MRMPNGNGSVYKLSGNRRKPYAVRVTLGWDLSPTGKAVQRKKIIGYFSDRKEAMAYLLEYNRSPLNISSSKLTFKDVYELLMKDKEIEISKSNLNGYRASFLAVPSLHDLCIRDIKLNDIERAFNLCGKNYPTMRKIRVMIHQVFSYAMRHEYLFRDVSKYIDITKYRDKNPNSKKKDIFHQEHIDRLWCMSKDKYKAIMIILIYTGVRVGELLNLKSSDVHLEEQYFDVIESKTINGLRKVPIADKIKPLVKEWLDDNCEYLIHKQDGTYMSYENYRDTYWDNQIKLLNLDYTPHSTRHTFISMLARINTNPTVIKKIVGHSGAMSLTERVYTHFEIKELIDAVNKI